MKSSGSPAIPPGGTVTIPRRRHSNRDNVKERVQNAVEAGLTRLANAKPPTDHANAANERALAELRQQVADLTKSVATMQRDLATYAAAQSSSKVPGNDGGGRPGGNPNRGDLKWTKGLQLNPNWNSLQKRWWKNTCRQKEPERYKAHVKANLQKQQANLQKQLAEMDG